jgi:hypothetical protein
MKTNRGMEVQKAIVNTVREIITICFEKYTKSINSLCGQNVEIYMAKNSFFLIGIVGVESKVHSALRPPMAYCASPG